MDYDADYFVRMSRGDLAKIPATNRNKWKFIMGFQPPPQTVLDYGSGLNFLQEYAPEGVEVDSFDIGRLDGVTYPQTGIRREHYDLICLFEVMHLVDWENAPDVDMARAIQRSDAAAVSVPIWSGEGEPGPSWQHWKPGENLTLFTAASPTAMFREVGMKRQGPMRRRCWGPGLGAFRFQRTMTRR